MKKLLNILLIITFILAALLISLKYFYQQPIYPVTFNAMRLSNGVNSAKPVTLLINGKTITVEIADQAAEQIKGLSERKALDADSGMLFVYPDKKFRSFWMKDMNFPLDIIWLDDNTVVGLEKNLAPAGSLPSKSYESPLPVNYILEVNAGFTDKYAIKIGDKVKFFNK